MKDSLLKKLFKTKEGKALGKKVMKEIKEGANESTCEATNSDS